MSALHVDPAGQQLPPHALDESGGPADAAITKHLRAFASCDCWQPRTSMTGATDDGVRDTLDTTLIMCALRMRSAMMHISPLGVQQLLMLSSNVEEDRERNTHSR